jgi:hypothetical protein
VALNGEELGVVNFDGAAEHRALLENVPTSLLRSTGNELTITLNERPEVHAESLMFDWVEIQYPTPSFLASDMAELAIPGAVTGQTFELQGIASDRVHLFCLSNNSVVPVETQIDVTGGLTASFTAPCDNGLYAIATSDRFLSPSGVEPFAPELPLVPDHPVDHLIITHGDFRSAADRLAQHRREHGGLSSMVVDVQDIYDRFNHGIISSEALRDGLRHVWQTWPEPKPRYVLLIGDASWDWHQLESSVPNFIPTHFYPTNGPDYASDSHFAMVDDEQIPRFAVGRLPTKTLEEADGVVDKLIAYDLEMERERVAGEVGDWRRRIIFAASDNPRYRNFLNKAVETHIEGRFELTRAYADDESPLDCTQALVDAFNGGVSFVSYVGHGARGVWQTATSMARTTADYEANFRPSRVDDLHNATQLPIVFGITCFTNNFDNPSPVNCIGERLVLSPSGGAIACIGTSSYSYISSDLIMCDALFEALFEDGVTRVGDMYLNAIGRDRVSAEIRKMFIVLGDPASAIPIQAPDGTLVSASEGTNVSSAPEASPEVAAN